MADTTGQYRVIHAALMAWFHGGAHYPYAATGHGTDPEECWQCHEAAQVAAEVTANGPSGTSTTEER